MKRYCLTCKIELDSKPEAHDCGGDCLQCMADSHDPDCMIAMVKLGHVKYLDHDAMATDDPDYLAAIGYAPQ